MRPTIALTMGDPAGIAPEILVKTLALTRPWTEYRPLVIGDPKVMRAAEAIVRAGIAFREVELHDLAAAPPAPAQAPVALEPGPACRPGVRDSGTGSAPGVPASGGEPAPAVDLYCPTGVDADELKRGLVDARMGKAAALCLQAAYRLVGEGMVGGVVSGPLNKEAFHRAGYEFFDELEYLAHVTKAPKTFILRVAGPLVSVSVTEHIPFRTIADHIKRDRVLEAIRRLDGVLRSVKGGAGRIAVSALNVHGGEGGLFGREELDEIAPAIQDARSEGITAEGPIPADTVYVRAFAGEFAGVVAMYHDQANIAGKLQPKRASATLFLGLPVICATTAHGTAFDKAGHGSADPGSMQTALEWAVRLAR